MAKLPPHGLPLIEENEDVAEVYNNVKQAFQSPFVPNIL
jgi:hypothetical protein